MACEETGMGVVEDKGSSRITNAADIYVTILIRRYLRQYEQWIVEDKAFGIKKIAEPVGGLVERGGHSDHETRLSTRNRSQMSHLSEDQECNHHQPASAWRRNVQLKRRRLFLEAAVKAGAPEGIIRMGR